MAAIILRFDTVLAEYTEVGSASVPSWSQSYIYLAVDYLRRWKPVAAQSALSIITRTDLAHV